MELVKLVSGIWPTLRSWRDDALSERKKLILEEERFTALGIPAPDHDKLPDVVLFDAEHNGLFLIEAVTSHRLLSPKRYVELEDSRW